MITRGVEAVRVLESLESGPKLLSDVIEDTGLPYQDVVNILRGLSRKGLVERAKGGFYYLNGGRRA